jgi:hypothetical protein
MTTPFPVPLSVKVIGVMRWLCSMAARSLAAAGTSVCVGNVVRDERAFPGYGFQPMSMKNLGICQAARGIAEIEQFLATATSPHASD